MSQEHEQIHGAALAAAQAIPDVAATETASVTKAQADYLDDMSLEFTKHTFPREALQRGAAALRARPHQERQIENLKSSHADLLEALKSLANEATGFHAMADPSAHGQTNLNCLQRRIDEACDAIAKAEGRS